MASETLHERKEDLSGPVLDAHRAYISLIEELEAVDWYNQRADATEDEALKRILIHNRDEEMEHACMVLEWLRRNQEGWQDMLNTYLFKEKEITELEEAEEEEEESEKSQDLKIGKISK